MQTIIRELLDNQNIRTNLSNLRKEIKDETKLEEARKLVKANEAVFLGFLGHEDAKSRKNAALLLGDLCYEAAAEALYRAYEQETTLFVKSAYLEAMAQLNAEAYIK